MRRSLSRAVASRPSRRRSGCKTRVASIERGPLFGAGRCAFGMAIIGDLSGMFSDVKTSSLVRLSLHVVSCMPLLVLVPHMPFRACRPSRVALLVRRLRSSSLLSQVKNPLRLQPSSAPSVALAVRRRSPRGRERCLPSLSPLSFTTPSQGRVQRGRALRAFARMRKLTQKEGAHAVW